MHIQLVNGTNRNLLLEIFSEKYCKKKYNCKKNVYTSDVYSDDSSYSSKSSDYKKRKFVRDGRACDYYKCVGKEKNKMLNIKDNSVLYVNDFHKRICAVFGIDSKGNVFYHKCLGAKCNIIFIGDVVQISLL